MQRKLLNEAITDPAYRATLLSIESLIDRAVCALVVFLMGGFLARGAMASFLVLLAVGVAVAMLVIAVLVNRTATHRTGARRVEEIPA